MDCWLDKTSNLKMLPQPRVSWFAFEAEPDSETSEMLSASYCIFMK